MKDLFRKIARWLQPNCPNCKDAKLYKNGNYHFPSYPSMNNIKDLYTCEKCKVEFIPL